jgi:hypothetical protein
MLTLNERPRRENIFIDIKSANKYCYLCIVNMLMRPITSGISVK